MVAHAPSDRCMSCGKPGRPQWKRIPDFHPSIAVVGLATALQMLPQACAAAGIDPLADWGMIALGALWVWPAADQVRLARLPLR